MPAVVRLPTHEQASVVIIEDETLVAMYQKELLEASGYRVVGITDNADEAFKLVQETQPVVAVVDVQIDGHLNGVTIAIEMAKRYKVAPVLVTAVPKVVLDQAWEFRYALLAKPFDDDEFLNAVATAYLNAQIARRNEITPPDSASSPK